MVKEFNEDGVSLRYPDNWTLELEQGDGGWTASLQSKETAFLVVTLDRRMPEPEQMACTFRDFPTISHEWSSRGAILAAGR